MDEKSIKHHDAEKSKYPPFLSDRKDAVDSFLFRFIENEAAEIDSAWPTVGSILPYIVQYVAREGKRIRPVLALLSYEAFGGNELENMLLPAIGTELMHDSFIIHDDLYDDLPNIEGTRRGERVLHRRIQDDFRNKTTFGDSNWVPSEFAKHTTIAIANILLALGSKTISDSDFSDTQKEKAQKLYWKTVEETWIGQAMDILSKAISIDQVNEEMIVSTEESRAGVYTVEFPVLLGAIFAGADEKSLATLSVFGRAAGLAFEIYDDVLAIFGEESNIGKIKADLVEGKRTILLQKALERANPEQQKILHSVLANDDFELNDVQTVKDIFIATGALAYTLDLINRLVVEAENAANELQISEYHKDCFIQLARFTINRTR